MIIVMASEGDIESSYGTEARMCDPTCWWRNHYKGDGEMVTSVIPRLQSLLGRLRDLSLTAEATEFWKRAVIEAVTANVVAGMPSERDGPLPSALKIVRQVEEYLDARPSEPIHISEICSHLHVPRRTLHRAFHEALCASLAEPEVRVLPDLPGGRSAAAQPNPRAWGPHPAPRASRRGRRGSLGKRSRRRARKRGGAAPPSRRPAGSDDRLARRSASDDAGRRDEGRPGSFHGRIPRA